MSENYAQKPTVNHAYDSVDSLLLDTITQTANIMKLFEQGATDKELIDYLQQEPSLARAYLIF